MHTNPKVLKIEVFPHWSNYVARVWAAASKVWQLPPYDLVTGCLEQNDISALRQEQAEYKEVRRNNPFRGWAFAPRFVLGDIVSVTVFTDASNRALTLSRWGHGVELTIAFPGGSLAAAGELVQYIWDTIPEDTGDTIIVYTDDGDTCSVDDYPGPVHSDLGRARWDDYWRERNPDLAGQAPTQQEEDAIRFGY